MSELAMRNLTILEPELKRQTVRRQVGRPKTQITELKNKIRRSITQLTESQLRQILAIVEPSISEDLNRNVSAT